MSSLKISTLELKLRGAVHWYILSQTGTQFGEGLKKLLRIHFFAHELLGNPVTDNDLKQSAIGKSSKKKINSSNSFIPMVSVSAACIVTCMWLCTMTSEAFSSLDDSRMSNKLSMRIPPSNTTDNQAHLLR